MSTALSTDLTIHAATQTKRKLIADLLQCFDFNYPYILDFGEKGLNMVQEDCGYVENLLYTVNTIQQMFIKQGITDIEYSIDGCTDCDYGVYCVFEIVCSGTTSYCKDTDIDTTELEEGFDPDKPLGEAIEAAKSTLKTLPWGRLDNHWAVENPVQGPFDKDALQKADDIISTYLSSL